LTNGTLKTKATIINQSPSSVPVEGKKLKAYIISAFQLELRNQLAICMQCDLFPHQIISNELLPQGKIVEYYLDIEIDPLSAGGNSNFSSLGFILEKEKNRDYEIMPTGGMFGMMFGGMGGGMGFEPRVDLRGSLLQKGDRVGHLFSTATYNAKLGHLSIYLCEDIFEQYSDYYVSVVRTDCWGTLDHNVVMLKNAKVSTIFD